MNTKLAFLSILCLTVLAVAWWFLSAQRQRPDVAGDDIAQTRPDGQRSAAPEPATPAATLVSAIPLETKADGYVGSDSCQECHQDYHQSWHASYHRTMTQRITPETAPPVIHDEAVVVEGKSYQFQRRGDDFLVEFDDPIAGGAKTQRRMVMMTGSHHMHVFWYESGIEKTPAQLPIIYLLDERQWIPRRSAFLRPTNMPIEPELGRWNSTCCQCHSTHPRQRPVTGTDRWDTEVGEFGISCEACHGPGRQHIQFHRNQPDAADNDDEPAKLVDPLTLSVDSQSDICARCHSIGIIDLEVIKKEDYYAHGLPFRPGRKLDRSPAYKVVRASPEHIQSKWLERWIGLPGMRLSGNFWPDGHIRISGRNYSGMIESACYQQGHMTCLRCHTMHQQDVSLQQAWKDDQLKPNMRGDDACLQCHPKYGELGTAHTHHPIDSEGSRCMNCHMPYTVYGLLKSIRSHTISSPSVAATIQTTRPNACNLCHLDHTLAETSDHLAQWYGHDKPELTEEETSTAASVLQLVKGDAAQRALQVNAYQWPPAQAASGTDWTGPYLLLGMSDPYEAIRMMAHRGYKSLPGTEEFQYDFLQADRAAVITKEFQRLQTQWDLKPNSALLINEQGKIDETRFNALISGRNGRTVYLQE